MTTLEQLNKKFYGLRMASGTDKRQVFIDEDNNVLLMGPFIGKDKGNKMSLVKQRYDKLKMVGAKYIARYVRTKDDWIVFEDFTNGYAIDPDTSQPDSGNTYIASMEEISKYIDICKKSKWIYDSPKAPELLETLVWLWVLKVSIQMQNVYVDTRDETFNIIDLDKSISDKHLKSGHRENEVLFFLARNPNIQCKFFEHMGQYYKPVVDQLEKKKLNIVTKDARKNDGLFQQGDLLRLNRAIELLDSHFKSWEVQYGGKAGEIGYEDVLPRKETEYGILGKGPMYGTPFFEKGKSNTTKSTAITFSGYDFNASLKWLTRHIRESSSEKAVMLAVELYHIKNAQGDYAKTHYGRFIKQLRVAAARDIGIANYPLALAIIDFLNRYEEDVTYVEIISIVIAMCDSPKTRLPHNLYKLAEYVGSIDEKMAQKEITERLSCREKLEENGIDILTEKFSNDYVGRKIIHKIPLFNELMKMTNDHYELAAQLVLLKATIEAKETAQSIGTLFDLFYHWCREYVKGEETYKLKTDQITYIDNEGKIHKTTRCNVMPWYALDKATVKKVNDDFWISNNILRYSYYKDIHMDKEFLILAVAAATQGLAYEKYALRFEEADPMDYYLPAARNAKIELDKFKSKDEDYLAKDTTNEDWKKVVDTLLACHAK